ncbi:MAG: hypothetical protein MUE85_06695 [Microscillaceae bacterium]|jgi:hypothetical protein|nr:hypothetical protein [Microscillaceae bacterium]
MKKYLLGWAIFISLIISTSTFAQSKAGDIEINKLPLEVKAILEEYLNILSNSGSLEDCAEKFVKIAGGSLVNEDGQSLRNNVQAFSLKKDYGNIKFYAIPLRITRVNVAKSNGTGYGASAVKGKVYKIWIDKKSKDLGLPAPVSIIVPENHEFINAPKVINIGSF